ncbi:hypothetical protein [Paludibacter jiangxiensis]|nr:hypothetical protein [Paludibacter jiangxiensis]
MQENNRRERKKTVTGRSQPFRHKAPRYGSLLLYCRRGCVRIDPIAA